MKKKILFIILLAPLVLKAEIDPKDYEIDTSKKSYEITIEHPNHKYCHIQIYSDKLKSKINQLSLFMKFNTTNNSPQKLPLQHNYHGIETTVGPEWLYLNTYILKVKNDKTFLDILEGNKTEKVYIKPLKCNHEYPFKKTH